MNDPEKEEVQAFSNFADSIYSYYTKKMNDAEDAFESYGYQQRLQIFLSPEIFRARIVRGYRVLAENLRLPKNK